MISRSPSVKRPVDDMRLGHEIALRDGLGVEGVLKDAPQILHRRRAGIDRQRRPAAQIAKAPAIIQAHDVVGVRNA